MHNSYNLLVHFAHPELDRTDVNGWRRKQAKNANFRGCNSPVRAVDFRRAHGLIIKSNKLCNCPVREAFCDRTSDDKNALEPRHVSILRLSPSTDRMKKVSSFFLVSVFFPPLFLSFSFCFSPCSGPKPHPGWSREPGQFQTWNYPREKCLCNASSSWISIGKFPFSAWDFIVIRPFGTSFL